MCFLFYSLFPSHELYSGFSNPVENSILAGLTLEIPVFSRHHHANEAFSVSAPGQITPFPVSRRLVEDLNSWYSPTRADISDLHACCVGCRYPLFHGI